MKTAILHVSCANQHASERPETFYITIDDRLARRIKKLSTVVVDLGVYSIKEFNYQGIWSEMYLDVSDINKDHSNLNSLLGDVDRQEVRVDVPMLVVTNLNFYFVSVPKHCGDDMSLSTSRVAISELDRPLPYVTDEV